MDRAGGRSGICARGRMRWGIRISDVEVKAIEIKRLGGDVHVPPTNTTIALFQLLRIRRLQHLGLVRGLKSCRPSNLPNPQPSGSVGTVVRRVQGAGRCVLQRKFSAGGSWTRNLQTDTYQFILSGGLTIGDCTRSPAAPPRTGFSYFHVEDIDAAVERVKRCCQSFEGHG